MIKPPSLWSFVAAAMGTNTVGSGKVGAPHAPGVVPGHSTQTVPQSLLATQGAGVPVLQTRSWRLGEGKPLGWGHRGAERW